MDIKPNHVGIVIDGTRRFAKREGIPLEKAYLLGAKKVKEAIQWLFRDLDVKELSIYAFSYDNLFRDSEERDVVLKVQEKEFRSWAADPFFQKHGIRITFIGELDLLPAHLSAACKELEARTAKNSRKKLNLLVGYLGKREIASAIKRISEKEEISQKSVSEIVDAVQDALEVRDDVDLVIRTANEKRLSGFLTWQAEYAELFFINKYWPEVTLEDFKQAIQEYAGKERRYGQ